MNYLRPDWVVIGIQDPVRGKFAIYASTELSGAELRREVEIEYNELFTRPQGLTSLTEVRLAMRGYTFITGNSYAECWRTLVEVWSPDPPSREAAQVESRKEIGA